MFSGRIALWCLYLAGVIALFVVAFINYVVEGFFSTLSRMLFAWAFLSFDCLCIARLYAYLRSLVLFAESVWQILVVLLGIRLSSPPLCSSFSYTHGKVRQNSSWRSSHCYRRCIASQ